MMAAFVFDIDGTLYLRSDPYLQAYEETFGGRFDMDFEKLFAVSRKWSDIEFYRCKRGEITEAEMNVSRNVKTFREMGVTISDEEGAAFHRAYVSCQKHLRLRPAMEESLRFLKEQGYFLGIITNGGSEHQRDKYRALGISDLIPEDHVMASDDVGIHKPDPRIFSVYAERFGLANEDCWFIGDDPAADIKGAKNAGWHAVLIRRQVPAYAAEEGTRETLPEPDFALEGDEGLPALLYRILQKGSDSM